MWRPAGMSSEEEEENDDDRFGFSSDIPNSQINHKSLEVTQEDKFFALLKNNDINEMKIMIQNGFKVDTPLESGWSALLHSCFLGKPEVVKLLLESGADPNLQKDFFTPLMAVCSSRTNEDDLVACTDYLLEHKADVNETDKYATTALMFAVKEERLKLISKLIKTKCNIDKQDCQGWTALFHAILKNNFEAVKLLVDAGCKLNLQDIKNRSAYELAAYLGHKEIANILCTSQDIIPDFAGSINESALKDPVQELIQQLPYSNGKNDTCGFPSEVISLLYGMDMERYTQCFIKHNVQLGEFLTISDKRLKEIGVRFSSQRQHILSCIKKFHLRQWSRSSLGLKDPHCQIEIEDADRLMAVIIKHLHVLKATVHYTRKHMPKEIKPEAFQITESALHQLDLIVKELNFIHSFAKYTEKSDKIIHVDLIKKKELPSLFERIIKIASVGFIIGIVLWKNRMIIIPKVKT